jgi:hypothetical protein
MGNTWFYLIPAALLALCSLNCPGSKADTIIDTSGGTRIILPSTAPDYSSSTVRIEKSTVPRRTTVTTVTEGPFLGKPHFARRLELMKEQLDNAISRGWIGPADAGAFNARYADMLSQLQLPMTRSQAESMEKQLNAFNIDLSDKMSTASVGIIQ